MKKVRLIFLFLFLLGTAHLSAQSAFERFGNRILKRADGQIELRVEQKAGQGASRRWIVSRSWCEKTMIQRKLPDHQSPYNPLSRGSRS